MFCRRLLPRLVAMNARRGYAETPAPQMFLLYTEQFGSVGTKGGRLMMHGIFSTRAKAEQAIEAVKKELDYSEEDPSFFFGIEKCSPDQVYAQGVVKERLSKASVYD
eukprot:RCo037187